MLAERETLAVADDEVIEHAHVDEAERLPETPRDDFIRLARLEDPGWVLGCVSGCNHRLVPLGTGPKVPHPHVAPASVRGE